MCSEQVEILWELMKLIESDSEIPYALERRASSLNINIERLREVIKDIDEKIEKFSTTESWETGVSDSEEYDGWYSDPHS